MSVERGPEYVEVDLNEAACAPGPSVTFRYDGAPATGDFTKTVSITRHDETVAFILSRERMEAIAETLEILANPEAMKAIRSHQSGKMPFQPLSALDDN